MCVCAKGEVKKRVWGIDKIFVNGKPVESEGRHIEELTGSLIKGADNETDYTFLQAFLPPLLDH